jgi:acetyl-CoA C-acetyltransferase
MNEKVAIVGTGHSKFGKREGLGIRELAFEAVSEMMNNINGNIDDIDASVIGVAGDEFSGQGAPAAVLIDEIGMAGKPTIRIESACATGTASIKTAYSWIKAGLYDTVMVVGVEKMTSVTSARATELMARAGDVRWESPYGVSFPGYYALLASAHMDKYNTTREMLSSVGVKNHHYGSKNALAHIQKEVGLEEAINAVPIAHPLNLYDCSLISDGAASIILTKESLAKKFTDTPVLIKGIGSGSDTMQMSARKSLTSLAGTKQAAKKAYEMANISPIDVDVAEVHDCFTIAEIIATEDLGFFEVGKGGEAALDQQTYIGGKIPVNVDGGLKSKGHPLGATGVSQAVELTKQLLGEVKGRQVDDAKIGLSHNVGQTGQFVNVIIYERSN